MNPDTFLTRALEYAKQYGPVINVRLGPKVLIFLTEAQDIEIILSSSVHLNKSEEYQ